MKLSIKLFLFVVSLGFVALRADENFVYGPVDGDQAMVELVSGIAGVEPGSSFDVAVRFDLDSHWHIYWTNPGDTGMPPAVDWVLPEGVTVGELEFPVPERIPTHPYVSYGYEGEVFLLARVEVGEDVAVGSELDIRADVSWLACEQSCVPGRAKVGTKISVVESGAVVEANPYDKSIEASRAAVAVNVSGSVEYEVIENSVTARFAWSGFEAAAVDDVYFYIDQESVVDSAKEQGALLVEGDLVLSLPKSEFFDGDAIGERLSGILYSPSGFAAADGAKALYFDSTVSSVGGGPVSYTHLTLPTNREV